MTEEERMEHQGRLMEMHIKLKEEIRKVDFEVAPYIEIWKLFSEEFQNRSTEYSHPYHLDQYPSAAEALAVVIKLRRIKKRLRRVRAAALKMYGIELR